MSNFLSLSVLLLLCLIIGGCNCCCNRRTDKNQYPKPELIFPGVSEWAANEGSADASSFISSIVSTIYGFVPGGQVVGPVLSGISYMNSMLAGAENGWASFVDRSLAVVALSDIKAKLERYATRFWETGNNDGYGKRSRWERTSGKLWVANDAAGKLWVNSSYYIPLAISLDKCEEILQKFTHQWGPLFKRGNSLVSTPSLVAFTKIYAGVAIIGFNLSPEKRFHIHKEMELLLSTLKTYRSASVSFRMLYLKKDAFFRTTCTIYCEDGFYEVISCDSCYKVKCDSATIFVKAYDVQLFYEYSRELEFKYDNYYKEPVEQLEAFTLRLQSMVPPYPSEYFIRGMYKPLKPQI